MEEWKTYKLGDLVNLYSGGTPNKSKAGYWGGSIPWISAKSMYEDFLSTSDLFITESGLKAGSKLAKKDTILLLTRGSGLFNRIPVCWTERDLAFNQDVKNIVSKDDSVLLNQYLYYWLYGNKAGITAILETTGIGAGKIDTERFLSLDVSIPSVDEQNRIIRIVEPIFDKIAINNRINHNLEEQAKNHFEEWCRQCNEEKTIAELSFNILDYSQNQRDKVVLLNSSDVTEGVFETLPYVDNKNLKGQFKKRFKKGDILYSEIRPRNHHYAICYFDAEDYIASTRLMIIRRNPELVSSDALLYQYLLMRRVEEEFTSKTESRSGTFPQGNYEDLSSSMVPYSRENQIISKTLDAFYSIIWLNMEENKRLASFRDALLPQLMLGDLTC